MDNNGAPRGERHYVIYNPPVVNEDLGIRASSVKEAAKIGSIILRNKIPAIIFARSRLRVEIVSTYLRELCGNIPVTGYRGGYLPNERRAIERGLREGSITGVVSTNALELGIDIGMLDAVISVGYPGSISSMHQQFGRAGRRGEPSLSVMVATSSPLDQYICNNTDFFVKSNPESAVINPDNLLVLMDHLKCAAFELPFHEDERFSTHLGTTREMLEYLESEGVLKKSDGKFHWMSDIYPANGISLRTASQENFVIVDTKDKNRVIGEVDYYSAPTDIHDDAIYIHQGRQHYIDKLDWERRTAYCHEVESDYYTDAESKTDLNVLEKFQDRPLKFASLCAGRGERAQHGGDVQEDQVQHPREPGLGKDTPAGDRDAHRRGVAGLRRGGPGARLRQAHDRPPPLLDVLHPPQHLSHLHALRQPGRAGASREPLHLQRKARRLHLRRDARRRGNIAQGLRHPGTYHRGSVQVRFTL